MSETRDWRARIASHVCTERCQVRPVTDFYCPTDDRVTGCPGPCPDGQAHEPRPTERLVHRD